MIFKSKTNLQILNQCTLAGRIPENLKESKEERFFFLTAFHFVCGRISLSLDLRDILFVIIKDFALHVPSSTVNQ